MTLRASVADLMPARAQDALRVTYDLLPSRRRQRVSASYDDLVGIVSPGGAVLRGPFTGLRLDPHGMWGGNGARVAGNYEKEIAPAVDALLAAAPPLVIDIGAAEGYYAVGVALRLPQTPVIAFELEQAARALCRRNRQINGVTNLRVRGRVTPRALQRVLVPGALVICDVEGYEIDLLDPARVPGLLSCRLLVELHEFAVQGVTAALSDRFAPSHEVTLIDAIPRTSEDAAHLGHMRPDQALWAVQEGRPTDPPMQWAVMTPHTVSGGFA